MALKKPESCIIIIFGIPGDLTRRKLIPAIFELYKQGSLPENFSVLGTASSPFNDVEFPQ